MANANETPPATCKACGSEVVETVNGSNFHDGECGPCEYRRYRSQPKLVEACATAYGVLCDLSYNRCFRWGRQRFREANELIDTLADLINRAHGEEP